MTYNKQWPPITMYIHVMLCIVIFTCASARADDWNVEGEHGELHVYGALTEGACQINMESRDQQIDLGYISNSALRHPGDSGKPVYFEIKLDRCIRSGGVQTDRYKGGLVWDSQQPVVTLSFLAQSDPAMPTLIKANGISGLGLRIEDSLHRTVTPGERGEPLFLTPGSNVLAYTVTPVRTEGLLTTGFFQATVNFQVNYD